MTRESRFYDTRRWRDHIRPAQLKRQPLCEFCRETGRTTAATEVDHKDGDPENNHPSNLRSLCKSCHSHRTMAEQVHGGQVHLKGCDSQGDPVDPNHHWT